MIRDKVFFQECLISFKEIGPGRFKVESHQILKGTDVPGTFNIRNPFSPCTDITNEYILLPVRVRNKFFWPSDVPPVGPVTK